MFLSDISIKRPIMITMAMIGLLLFGIVGFMQLPLNLMPDTKVPVLTIQTIYPGASSDQIEKLITTKIEDEISSISLIDNITSYSLNSVSLVIIKFELDKDIDVANQEVKDKLDAIADKLPDNADSPVVSKLDLTATSVINLVLSGDVDSSELYKLANSTLKDKISRLEGVGSVDIYGGQEKEIRVNFENKTVFENAINLTQVASVLATANIDMPGGNFQNETEEYSVRMDGQIKSIEELGEIQVPTSTGMRELDQVASSIEKADRDVRERITFFDKSKGEREENSVLISVVKSSKGNPVTIAEAIYEILPEIQSQLPENINLTVAKDESVFIKGTVNDTMSNIILGIILTAAIILFFLHDFRSTLIVALAMPLSIIPTFIVMKSLGITINVMSLMGISVSVGVLVQNSVVVLENIFRQKSLGLNSKDAASKGTSEVTIAVVASTMTNICVFLPIGLMGGIAGLFLRDFALTVVIATIFSLLISFTLTPMLSSLLLPDESKKKNVISRGIESLFSSLEKGYTRLLTAILKSRLRSTILILGTVAIFGVSIIALTKIPFEFTPAMDSGQIKIEIELPLDASLGQTAMISEEIETIIVKDFPEIKSVLTNLGGISSTDTGTNLARMDIELIDKTERDSNKILTSRIGNSLTEISNASIRVLTVSGAASTGSAPINFYLQSDDPQALEKAALEVENLMNTIPGLTSINSSLKPGKPEIVLTPNKRTLSEMGITTQTLAMSMRSAIEGVVLTQMKTEGNEYDIRVSLDDIDTSSYEDISNIAVATKFGIYPLSYFAEVDFEDSISKLMRADKVPSVELSADILPGYVLGNMTSEIENRSAGILSDQVKLKWTGDVELMDETKRNMGIAFAVAILLTFMLLAAVLEKVGQPLLILSTVPLSMIGVVAFFKITGFSMNMVSMLAIIMLVGMVVNNAILILEYTNQLRKEGMNIHDALIKACPTKLQPILMANIATILGMLPMALGFGASGAEMRQPLGVVSIGGLLAATLLTLFVVPAIENAIESKKDKKNLKTEATK